MSEVLDSLHPTLRELPGKTIVERYRIDAALGVGGMGAVFRGRHLGLKRDVAIKVLHPDLTRDPEISKRFDREAHSASRLDHPNCLRVTDVGTTEDGVKFMVMDLLSGGELADRLGEPLLAERAVLMVMQILRGLEHAHEHGVIHRDVKPENIFITRDHEGREVLKLVDFGIAKLAGGNTNDTRMTKAGLIFGTPAYMSPEQAMGMEADARADLYAVGVILYEMLAGTPPFESNDPVKLVRMQVSRDAPPLPDHVAPALAAVVMRLLAKDRDERFQTATEAREHLEAVLPVVATGDVISGVTLYGSRSSGPIIINPGTGPIPTLTGMGSGTGPIPIMPGRGSGTGPIPTRPGMASPTGPLPMGPSGSAPIPVTSSVSAPISVSMPMPAELSSSSFSPAALPTLPPGSAALRQPSRTRVPLIAGVAAVVLALGLWAVSRGDGGDADGSLVAVGGGEAGQAIAGDSEGDEGDGGVLSIIDGPDDRRLAEVDRLIFSDKLGEAQQLLQPMLDEYPNNAMLAWRQGRIHAKSRKRKNKPKALAAYGDAVDAEPALLVDNDFYAELHALLVDDSLRTEALDFALRKMGRAGHKFLLELVNNERKPMGYNDRRRALQELSTVEENDALVDWRLHRALDVGQAKDALTPCTAYRDALDNIAASPDYWFLSKVERSELPKPKSGKKLTAEEQADVALCEGLEARRAEVLAELELLAPVEETGTDGEDDEVLIIEDDEPGTGSQAKKTGSKSGGSTTKKSAKCNKPFGWLNKQCR